MDPVFILVQIAAVVLFGVAIWGALSRGRLPLLELTSAAAYGLLLEQGDQLIFETYHYAPGFVAIDRAPIAIGLIWALILTGAMRITDALSVRRRYAPFVDSVLALSLDLAFDAIAIRMGFWTWRDVGPEQGWFGVPAGNFYSWLFVVVGFSLVSRWLADASRRRRALEWLQLLVPIPSFVILLTAIGVYAALQGAIDPERGGGMVIFLVTLAVFVAIAGVGIWDGQRSAHNAGRPSAFDLRLAFFTRLSIHGFFLVGLLVLGVAAQLPVLLIVALLMLALELPLAWLVASRGRQLGEPLVVDQRQPLPERRGERHGHPELG